LLGDSLSKQIRSAIQEAGSAAVADQPPPP